MKQHITVEQLHEYLELEMQAGKTIDFNPNKFDNLSHAIKLPQDRVLTEEMIYIGKMIEILKNNNVTDIGIKLNSDRNNISIWKKDGCVKRIFEKELCDSLWEALKYILESEEEE